MKPSDIISLIQGKIKANVKRGIIILGSPGLGKTQIPKQAADGLGIGFMDIHAPLLQPEDYGFPVINAARDDVDFIVSKNKFPVEGSNCPERGIFLIDELPQCDASAQKVLANLIQSREIHGQKLKAGWTIVVTGNRAKDRAGANRILSHLNDRMTSINIDVSIDDWTNWALSNGVKTEVIAFIRFRPELLSKFDPHAEKFASPRGWVEGVSDSLGAIDSKFEAENFTGDVGEGPAAEFLAFVKIFRKLPSPDTILIDPAKTKVPTDAATLYAICGALANRATGDNFGRLMIYINRLPAEFSILFIRDVITCKTNKDNCACNSCQIKITPDFIKWASGPGAKILT